jgi:hypothetical protein
MTDQGGRFLETPVQIVPESELDSDYVAAVRSLAAGRNPFGIGGLLGKKRTKLLVEQTRVLGLSVRAPADWSQVDAYIRYLIGLRHFAVRWQALAPHLGIEMAASDGLTAIREFEHYVELLEDARIEKQIASRLKALFPTWSDSSSIIYNGGQLDVVERILSHHRTIDKLAEV